MLALVGFSSSCKKDKEKDYEPISITVTGDFNEYVGWEAAIGLHNSKKNEVVAVGLPLAVKATTTSLNFQMINGVGIDAFDKPGNYMVVFYFHKQGEKDAKYFIVSKAINEGPNSIEFSSFQLLLD